MSDAEDFDPVTELAEIARSLKAHIDWQLECGAVGLPRDPDAKNRIREALAAHSVAPAFETSASPPPVAETQQTPSRALAGAAGESPRRELSRHEPSRQEPPRAEAPHRQQEISDSAAADTPPERSAIGPASSDLPRAVALPVHADVLSLGELAERVAACTACSLAATRTQTVFSRGRGTSGLCFIGEGPGADEDAQGEPFVGKAGQLLDRMIQAMGFERDDVYVMNIVKCRPPNNRKPAPEEMRACSGFLQRQLELLNPHTIVALGATAVEGLLGATPGITKIRGHFRLYRGEIAVMPTFHPAYLLRNPSAKREVWSDLQQVVAHMGRTLPRSP